MPVIRKYAQSTAPLIDHSNSPAGVSRSLRRRGVVVSVRKTIPKMQNVFKFDPEQIFFGDEQRTGHYDCSLVREKGEK